MVIVITDGLGMYTVPPKLAAFDELDELPDKKCISVMAKPSSLLRATVCKISFVRPYGFDRAGSLTLHSNSLVVRHTDFRQATLLQVGLAIDVQFDLLILHDRRSKFSKGAHVAQVQGLVDMNHSAVIGLDLRNPYGCERRCSPQQADSSIEGVDSRMEHAVGADDLCLVQEERIRRGIGDDHLLDLQSGIIDVALCDVWIANIHPIVLSIPGSFFDTTRRTEHTREA